MQGGGGLTRVKYKEQEGICGGEGSLKVHYKPKKKIKLREKEKSQKNICIEVEIGIELCDKLKPRKGLCQEEAEEAEIKRKGITAGTMESGVRIWLKVEETGGKPNNVGKGDKFVPFYTPYDTQSVILICIITTVDLAPLNQGATETIEHTKNTMKKNRPR
jgi:hypothetical protein